MGTITPPLKVKFVLAMFATCEDLFPAVLDKLVPRFGNIDLESQVVAFDHTEYYKKEMGPGLLRKWVSFERLIPQDGLPEIKILTNELEEEFADSEGNRRINLDPGYLTAAKLVLASTKDFAHRLYLGQGIYGEITLVYNRSRGWQSHEWTYPDYKAQTSLLFFKQVRQIYLKQRRYE